MVLNKNEIKNIITTFRTINMAHRLRLKWFKENDKQHLCSVHAVYLIDFQAILHGDTPVSEFNEFKPRFKSPKTGFN